MLSILDAQKKPNNPLHTIIHVLRYLQSSKQPTDLWTLTWKKVVENSFRNS